MAEVAPTLNLNAFPDDPIPTPPVTASYRVALVLVALMTVLIPLVYLGVVGGIGYFLVRFAIHGWSFLHKYRIGLFVGGYIALLLAGLTVLCFMLTPLLGRRGRRAQPLALNPEAEPVLFDFIARICRSVGASMPSRIDLDCQFNASAGFRKGPLTSSDLVLTIGLPLVAGLNVTEFAGVVAHEFGHFTQGSAMRLSYWVRAASAWLEGLVTEDTPWDTASRDGTEEDAVGLGLLATQLLIGAARLPLRLMVLLSGAASGWLLHQMEFDADRYEIELVGSAAFEAAARRFRVLQRALMRSYEALKGCLQKNRGLPDNLPNFMLYQEGLLPLLLRTKLEQDAVPTERSWFSTHPSDAARAQRARALNAPGRMIGTGPARNLFANFDAVARQVTILHYRDDLGFPALDGLVFPWDPRQGALGNRQCG